ncbi:amidohydrolase family protein [Actinomyces sp. B33]|uniref:N-acetylglucosamine-6-phosphate deacetylase n=1 Tax=Actinomyces sp. B33 TaxID=2942131 RepID=UPI002342285E|nr:amidohydrolase family protein [Actinomyces sp. B33]MDC4232864.1 amidohydrolase family protein [Actinomyces sp. B33]
MSTHQTLLRGRLVLVDRIIDDGVLVLEGDTITRVLDAREPGAGAERLLDEAAPSSSTFLPGLVDVHCHGGGGSSFPNSTSREQAQVAIDEHRRHGTTTLVSSLVTAHADVLRERAALLAELAEDGELAGIHFEGPFVSHARCGAQDPQYIIDPDPALTRELLDICKGHALSMTLAPEKDGAYGPGSVAEVLIRGRALPSWGHTDSGSAPARAALEYSREEIAATPGARCAHATITHLFNGMRPLHHRDTGPIAEFLSDATRGGAIAEMICDGVHLDPTLVRDVYEMLGRDACVLVTDAMEAAGMPNGTYELGSQRVDVADGFAYIAGTTTLAGGTAHLLDCVRVATAEGGIPLVDAVYMASAQGAKILADETIGRLEAGVRADVVEVDSDLRPLRVWRRGVLV